MVAPPYRRIGLGGIGMIRIGMAALALGAALMGAANAQTATALTASAQTDLVKRGDYLVNGIMTCGNCHSPKGPPNVVAGKEFTGGPPFDLPPFTVTPSNITQDKETGIGSWSDADIKKLLRTGVRPNGVPIASVMPVGFYGVITDRDMDAIIAYLRTIKPVSNKVPDPVYRMATSAQIFPGTEHAYTDAMMSDPLKRGFYLASIGHCMECHTPMTKGHRDFANDAGKGGMEFPGPWGKSVSRNITSSKAKGLGDWSDAELKRAITQGIDKDGNHLMPPMGFGYYAHMTDADLNALVAWLRTVPAKE
jgi:mono/diheme cytochrome c family protein